VIFLNRTVNTKDAEDTMNPHGQFVRDFEEEYNPIEFIQQQFSEIGLDSPKQFPMRRKNKQRVGGVQQKHKRNEKKISSILKYQIEW
jgi:hypothetical protein